MNNEKDQKNKKITLFLITEKGYEFLLGTCATYKHLFELVVVGNDKLINNDFEEKIIDLCLKENIKFKLKKDFKVIKTDYAIAVSWRWIIKHPYEKLIIFHDSILPKYRGFAPLVNSLINGESEIGVTALLGAKLYDTGSIIAQSKTSITYPIKINEAIKINNKNYIKCANIVMEKILKDEKFELQEQVDSKATYSIWLDSEDYTINWNKSSEEIVRFIDAVGYPYTGAKTTFNSENIIIHEAIRVNDLTIENRHNGKVIYVEDGMPVVVCGKGLLKILSASVQNNGGLIDFFPLPKFRIRFK